MGAWLLYQDQKNHPLIQGSVILLQVEGLQSRNEIGNPSNLYLIRIVREIKVNTPLLGGGFSRVAAARNRADTVRK